jgi:transposase
MDKRPELERVSEPEKDALIIALWAEMQRLKARLVALEAQLPKPRKDAHHPSVPPSHSPKANRPTAPRTGTRRDASVGRAGGGRPLHPNPDQVIMAQAKTCPHGGGAVPAHVQHLHTVYDKIELPPVTPIVTRVEQHGGECPHCGQPDVAPVPVGMEPGTPFGASIEGLATYLRYTHAISDARLSALLAQV